MNADRYLEVRSWTEELAQPLSPEDQTVQSMPDVSPTKWHRGHTTWFFETFILAPFEPRYTVFDEDYGYLFNSYYETIGARYPRPQRGMLSRPGVEEIAAYRQRVDQDMADFVVGAPSAAAESLVELGLHHEQQHQELLLMDIKHVLSLNPTQPVYRPFAANGGRTPRPPAGWHEHEGGIIEIGMDGDGFCFDNETPRHQALIQPFELKTALVTCGEWLAFMDDGGYQRPDLWMSDGWATVKTEQWQAPLYWQQSGPSWTVFTLGGLREMDPAEPVVHVSWFEADAFARWAGARLPTEAEWEAVAPAPLPATPATGQPPRLHPAPAGPDDPQQWYGQVWQWTASSYNAYPGFRPAAGAVGEYNGKFMINQQVLRGSCSATPPGHARHSYRNFFPPSARWAFAGLRLARDVGTA